MSEERLENEEYTTFHIIAKDGSDVEMAVLEEFEYERHDYVAAAIVQGDEILADGVYIYKAKVKDGELIVDKITDPKEYENVSKAYLELD